MKTAPFLKNIKDPQKALKKLFDPKKKYTAIAGAGISMDPPSLLLSAKQIVDYLIDICCPDEEKERILKQPGLRYELVIGGIEKFFDKDLNFMNFFDFFEKPNMNHFFLARLLESNDADVITTNFDYLIELAAMELLGKDKYDQVKPVITRDDFAKFTTMEDIKKLKKKHVIPVCKIHGSKKNIITGENTRDSLVTTMADLGKDREGAGTFSVEPYKRPLLVNLTNDRSLIVMGYSGSDDFDIGPTLKELSGIKEIFWINHIKKKPKGGPSIFKVDFDSIKNEAKGQKDESGGNIPHIDQVLGSMAQVYKEKNIKTDIYRIDAPTSDLLSEYLWDIIFNGVDKPELGSSDKSKEELRDIIEGLMGENVKSDITKIEMAVYLYEQLFLEDDVLRCTEKGLEVAKKVKDRNAQSKLLTLRAKALMNKNEYNEALDLLKKALKYGGDTEKVLIYLLMGAVYSSIGNYREANKGYLQGIKLAKKLNEIGFLAQAQTKLGELYTDQGRYGKGIENLRGALENVDKIGDLSLKMFILNQIGIIQETEGNFKKAIKTHSEAFKIAQILGDKAQMSDSCQNIALTYLRKGDLDKGQEYMDKAWEFGQYIEQCRGTFYMQESIFHRHQKEYDAATEKALKAEEVFKKLNLKLYLMSIYQRLAVLYHEKNQFDLAIDYYNRSIDLCDETRNLFFKMTNLMNLSAIYHKTSKYQAGVESAKKALTLAEELVRMDPDAPFVPNASLPKGNVIYDKYLLAENYRGLEEWDAALEYYLQILPINTKLFDEPGQETYILSRIANCYRGIGKFNNAIEYIEKAIALTEELEDETKRIDDLQIFYRELGNIYRSMEDYDRALELFHKSLDLIKKIIEIRDKEDDILDLANHYNDIALTYDYMGDVEKAAEFYKKSIKTIKKTSYLENEVKMRENLAILYYNNDMADEAKEWYERTAEGFKKLGNSIKEAESYNMIGNCYTMKKNIENSIAFYKKALEISDRLDDNEAKRVHNLNIASCHYDLKQEKEAVYYYKKSIQYCDILGNKQKKGEAYTKLGKFYLYQMPNYREAVRYFRKGSIIFKEIDNKENLEVIYYFIGVAYKNGNEPEKAIKAFRNELEINEELDKQIDVAKCYAFIGNCYIDMKMYDENLKSQELYLETAKKTNSDKEIAAAYYNLGKAYNYLENNDIAIEHYRKSYDQAEKIDDLSMMDSALAGITDILYDIDKEKAIELYNERLKLNEKRENWPKIIEMNKYIAKMHADLERRDKAIDCYNKARKIAEDVGNTFEIAQNYANAAYSLEKSGKINEALDFYRKAADIRKKTEDISAISSDLTDLAMVYFRSAKYQESYNVFLEKYELIKDTDDQKAIMHVLIDLGNIAARIEKPKIALEHYQNAAEIAEAMNNINELSGLLGDIGNTYRDLDKFEESQKTLKRQKKIGEDYKDWKFTRNTLLKLAKMYEHFEYWDKSADRYELAGMLTHELSENPAEEYIKTAINLHKADVQSQAIAYWRYSKSIIESEEQLNEIFQNIKENYDNAQGILTELEKSNTMSDEDTHDMIEKEIQPAIDKLLKSIEAKNVDLKEEDEEEEPYRDTLLLNLHRAYILSNLIGNAHKSAEILNKIAKEYDKLKRHQASVVFYRDSINYLKKTDDEALLIETMCNMGKKLMNASNFDDAVDVYKMAENRNGNFGNIVLGWKIEKGYGDVYWNQKNYDNAIAHFLKALETVKQQDNQDHIFTAILDVAYTYRGKGENEKSVEFFLEGAALANKNEMKKREAKCLNEIGITYLDYIEQYDKSVEYFQKAFEIYEEINKEDSMSVMTRNVAVAYWYIGDKETGLKWFKEVYKLAEKQGNIENMLASLSELASSYRQIGKLKEADETYKDLEKLANKHKNKNKLREAYRGFARVAMKNNDLEEARDWFQKEIDLCEEINDDGNRQDAIQYLGKVMYELGDSEQAEDLYLQAADVNRKIRNFSNVVNCYMSAAIVAKRSEKWEAAIKNYEIAADIATQIEQYNQANDCYGNIAMIYTRNGDHEISAQYFLIALDLCKKWGNKQEIRQRMFDAATIYEKIPDLEAAVDMTIQRHELGMKIEDYQSAIRDMNNLGQLYYEMEEYEKSINAYKKGIDIAEEHDLHDLDYSLHQNLGTSYRNHKKYKQAEGAFESAIKIARKNNSPKDEAWTYGSIAISYMHRENYDEAIRYRKKGLKISEELGNLENQIMHLEGLVKACEAKADYSNSWKYRKLLRRREEDLRNIEQEKEYTTPYEGKIEDLFPSDEEYTFLVGAGISMNPPSNLASARAIVRDLLELCGPEEEVDELLEVRGLRYELIVEIIQDMFDENLDFMEYFEEIKEPNLVHLLCAEAILRGDDIVTTNFDYLIEFALEKILSKKNKKKIIPVITQEDFEKCSDPEALHAEDKYPVYKIHGSSENIITHVDTRESLKTTISALGKGKDEGTTFAIETYKKPAVYNLMNKRTLVVMGYSGSDDFDIGPTLKELPNLNRIIWINHTFDDEITAYTVKKFDDEKYWKDLLGVYPLLAEIKHDMEYEVIRINANTLNIIKKYLWNVFADGKEMPDLSGIDYTPLNFKKYVVPRLSNVTPANRYRFAATIYRTVLDEKGVTRVVDKGLELVNENEDPEAYINFLDHKASLYLQIGESDRSLELYEQSAKIAEKQDKWKLKGNTDIDIAAVHAQLGNYDIAIARLEECLSSFETENYQEGIMSAYTNLGWIYWVKGMLLKSMDYLEKSLAIAEELGDLRGKTKILTLMGNVYHKQEKYDKEYELLEEALQISISIGALTEKTDIINNMGLNIKMQGRFEEALEKYNEALESARKLNYLEGQVTHLSNISGVYDSQEKYEEAVDYLEQALEIARKFNYKNIMANLYNNLAMTYYHWDKPKEAYDLTIKSLHMFEELGNMRDADFVRSNLRDVIAKL